MTVEEVDRLERHLELRSLCRLGAERVEVVHGRGLSGLLLIWTNEGRPRMAFEYVSSDGQLGGTVVMVADVESEHVVSAARGFLSGLCLAPEADRQARVRSDTSSK